jgi:xylose isomerase
MAEDGKFARVISERYSSYSSGIGKDIVDGKVGFKELESIHWKTPISKMYRKTGSSRSYAQ